jgi:hypothetical protein
MDGQAVDRRHALLRKTPVLVDRKLERQGLPNPGRVIRGAACGGRDLS